MSSRASRTLYVGNLPGDISVREVEDLFYKYGFIVDIDLKLPPKPPAYCFIEFEDARDAKAAIRGRHGYNFDGNRLRVEAANGGRGQSSTNDRYRRRGVSRRSEYRVVVTALPSSASWQDLKDHMRRAGDVCFSEVICDSSGTTGIVDYTSYNDMKNAIRKLDDSEFKNPFSRGYIRVKEYVSKSSISRSRSRSYSRSRSHSVSRSRTRSRSPSPIGSRSRSKSPKHKAPPRSISKSRSRSPSQPHRRSRRHSVSRSLSRSRSRSRILQRLPTSNKPPTRRSRNRSFSGSPSPSRSHSPSYSHSPAVSSGQSLSPTPPR